MCIRFSTYTRVHTQSKCVEYPKLCVLVCALDIVHILECIYRVPKTVCISMCIRFSTYT